MRGQSGRTRSPSAASPVSVDEACAVALDMGVQEYCFVGRYLERCPQVPLSVQQVKSLDSSAGAVPRPFWYTKGIYSSAARGACALKLTCHHRRRQSRTI